MSGYHSPQVDVPVRLNTNESPFPPPTDWVKSIGAIAESIDWNRYPDRAATELCEAIARRHNVAPEQVFVANGSNEVIQTILLAYGGHGRTVATFEPTYQMYAQIARVTGAEVVEGERRADLTLDPIEIERVVARHQPAVTFLCNPNNPTGLVEPRENLEALLEVATGIVVVDEAYVEFNRDDSAVDGMKCFREHNNVGVLRTFSKAYGLAALRVGFFIGPENVAHAVRMTAVPFGVSSIAEAAAVASLAAEEELFARVNELVERRDWFTGKLDDLGIHYLPSQANFVWVPLGEKTQHFAELCEQQAVSVRPFFGEGVRISIGEQEPLERILVLLKALDS